MKGYDDETVRHPAFRIDRFPAELAAGRPIAIDARIYVFKTRPLGTKRVAEMDVLAVPAFGHDNWEFTLSIRSENIRPENRAVGHRDGHILFEQKFVSMACGGVHCSISVTGRVAAWHRTMLEALISGRSAHRVTPMMQDLPKIDV